MPNTSSTWRQWRYHDLPRPLPAAAYQQAVAHIAQRLATAPGIIALYQIGHQQHPGISDLDLFAVFANGQPIYQPLKRRELPTNVRYLLLHNITLLPQDLFEHIRLVLPLFGSLQSIFCQTPLHIAPLNLDNIQKNIFHSLLIFDYLVKKFFRLIHPLQYRTIAVRDTLCTLNSLKFTLRLFHELQPAASPVPLGNDFTTAIEELRQHWFDWPDSQKFPCLLDLIHQALLLCFTMAGHLPQILQPYLHICPRQHYDPGPLRLPAPWILHQDLRHSLLFSPRFQEPQQACQLSRHWYAQLPKLWGRPQPIPVLLPLELAAIVLSYACQPHCWGQAVRRALSMRTSTWPLLMQAPIIRQRAALLNRATVLAATQPVKVSFQYGHHQLNYKQKLRLVVARHYLPWVLKTT